MQSTAALDLKTPFTSCRFLVQSSLLHAVFARRLGAKKRFEIRKTLEVRHFCAISLAAPIMNGLLIAGGAHHEVLVEDFKRELVFVTRDCSNRLGETMLLPLLSELIMRKSALGSPAAECKPLSAAASARKAIEATATLSCA